MRLPGPRFLLGLHVVRHPATLLIVTALVALAAPALATHSPTTQYEDRAYAPPMGVDIRHPLSPSTRRLVLEDRLARRYRADESQPVALHFFSDGRIVSTGDPKQPFLAFGADALGRDVYSRLLYGARWSLGVTAVGVIGALLLGALAGGWAGTTGGRFEAVLMWMADWLLALPGAYLVLALRGTLPLVISPAETFWLMAGLFAFVAWPHVARGVRGIVSIERTRDYAEAARASGAGPWRLMMQLLPAARGFLAVEVVLLVPSLLVAEATVSYLGLGFPDSAASWGTLLQDASNVRVMREAPWMLAPALGVFTVALGAQIFGFKPGSDPVQTSLRPRSEQGLNRI